MNMLINGDLVAFNILWSILKPFVYDFVHAKLICRDIDNKKHSLYVGYNPIMPLHTGGSKYSTITKTIPTGDTCPDP